MEDKEESFVEAEEVPPEEKFNAPGRRKRIPEATGAGGATEETII